MSDLELLKDAAAASGLAHVDYSGIDYDGSMGIQLVDGIGRHIGSWNPLTDDGDAFRLAVRLKLNFNPIETHTYDGSRCPYSATRRMIVKLAAEQLLYPPKKLTPYDLPQKHHR